MAPTTYKLYAPPGTFRAFAPLIAAEYNGIHIEVVTNQDDIERAIATKSPTGKAPILETLPSGQVLFSSHSMARYVAGLRQDSTLLLLQNGGGSVGSGSVKTMNTSFHDRALIDAWIDWTAQDVELPACVWFYPVVGYMPPPMNSTVITKAKDDFASALKVLDTSLDGREYLVGDHITLADIVVACTLIYPFKLVCDNEYLKPFHNVVRWFKYCMNQPEFIAVVGKVELLESIDR